MASREDEENQGFKVSDHRRFYSDGTAKEPDSTETASEPPSEEQSGQKFAQEDLTGSRPPETAGEPEREGLSGEDTQALPADFPTLILSLASSAQISLGVAPHPGSGQVQKNLLQAQHAIDLLGVLQEKTRGNLSDEEDKLLQALLTDLRMRFLEAKKE